MPATQKMMCEPCGREMNHHADKLVDPVTAEQAARVDAALGGFVEETHTCPDCGKSKSQQQG
jgi:transcription elongation factor Elf1